jgi:predicted esterase YcpF (UPF0227 family)
MTQYITQAVYNGTKQNYAISGKSVDSLMKRIRQMKELRNATCFLFLSRRTGKLVDVRMN